MRNPVVMLPSQAPMMKRTGLQNSNDYPDKADPIKQANTDKQTSKVFTSSMCSQRNRPNEDIQRHPFSNGKALKGKVLSGANISVEWDGNKTQMRLLTDIERLDS